MRRSTLAGLGVLVLIAVIVAVPFAVVRPDVGIYSVGILTGIPSGFFFAFLTYYWQTPSLAVDVAPSAYDGISDGYWVQLRVRNTAWGFLGGGTALECRGRLKFTDGREFVTKWKSRPNPRRVVPLQTTPGQFTLIELADASLYEQARTQTIRPGQEEWLDVAFRHKTAPTENCYVAIPENFQAHTIQLFPECAIMVGPHPFAVTLEFQGGEAGPWEFTLVNAGGKQLDSSSLHIIPGRYPGKHVVSL